MTDSRYLSCLTAGVLAFTVALSAWALAGCELQAQDGRQHMRPSDMWFFLQEPPRWYVSEPGENYRAAFEYAKACSGVPERDGTRYEDVKWLVVSTGGLRNEQGKNILGVWLYPDTIAIDSAWVEALWIVAHESLHHLRHLRNEAEPHPAYPFRWPCMLMYEQNVPRQASGAAFVVPKANVKLRYVGTARMARWEEEP